MMCLGLGVTIADFTLDTETYLSINNIDPITLDWVSITLNLTEYCCNIIDRLESMVNVQSYISSKVFHL